MSLCQLLGLYNGRLSVLPGVGGASQSLATGALSLAHSHAHRGHRPPASSTDIKPSNYTENSIALGWRLGWRPSRRRAGVRLSGCRPHATRLLLARPSPHSLGCCCCRCCSTLHCCPRLTVTPPHCLALRLAAATRLPRQARVCRCLARPARTRSARGAYSARRLVFARLALTDSTHACTPADNLP